MRLSTQDRLQASLDTSSTSRVKTTTYCCMLSPQHIYFYIYTEDVKACVIAKTGAHSWHPKTTKKPPHVTRIQRGSNHISSCTYTHTRQNIMM